MELNNRLELNASADTAWQVLGAGFGDIGTWAVAITHSTLDGPLKQGVTRHCRISGFGPVGAGTVVEHLDEYRPAERRFTYTATGGMPWFVRSATNRWHIQPDGDRCVVHSRATIAFHPAARPFGRLLLWMMARSSRGFGEELRHRVETGQAHPRKGRGTNPG